MKLSAFISLLVVRVERGSGGFLKIGYETESMVTTSKR